jgi:hypothetical protein
MATDYYGTPSLLERIVGADLVVVGRPGRMPQVEPPPGRNGSRVYGIFEVAVDSVLMGDPPSEVLNMRVLGEGRDERATWTVPLGGDGSFLFLLAHDIEPEVPENLYAPVFSGVYPLTDEDHVNVPEEALDDRTKEEGGFEENRVSLDSVRRLIESVLREREDRRRQLEEMGLAELLDRPYPPIGEMPQQDRPYPPTQESPQQAEDQEKPQQAENGARPATVDWTVDQ